VEKQRELTGALLALAVVRFTAELGMLAALAYAGWRLLSDTPALGIVAAIALPVVAAVVWGAWVAPKATRRLEDPARLAVELVLFGAAVAGLLLVVGGTWGASPSGWPTP
jgi:hypothetical protein